ncbi:holin [Niallia circulans]|uniref:phage holin n=1 Tax=Niallia circulans TaxID=1397 RepID=UPI00077C1B77|nr:phage holin [Niallia circulans]MDR4314977.1 phage holin [Niallia circulans]MED3837706.1 phage holin [Niallia circulans]MED4243148.1 phage holin [Niallia circulans]MED4247127.1 phage holin [Niallia circulans]QKH61671.1 phage holin [Niallia circulans]
MKKFDKGTIIRLVLLLLALINQSLIVLGVPVIPIEEGQITSLIDALYLIGSIVFTIVTALTAWYKNNYVTKKGMKQKEVLKEKNLTNAK